MSLAMGGSCCGQFCCGWVLWQVLSARLVSETFVFHFQVARLCSPNSSSHTGWGCRVSLLPEGSHSVHPLSLLSVVTSDWLLKLWWRKLMSTWNFSVLWTQSAASGGAGGEESEGVPGTESVKWVHLISGLTKSEFNLNLLPGSGSRWKALFVAQRQDFTLVSVLEGASS